MGFLGGVFWVGFFGWVFYWQPCLVVGGAAGGGQQAAPLPVQRVDVLSGDHTARLLGPAKPVKFIQHCFICRPWDRTQDCCDFGSGSQKL